MANHKSAKKRAKQNIKRRARNKSYVSQVKTAVKKFRAAVSSIEGTSVHELFAKAQSLLSKAATKGMLHRNNTARRISRMSAQLAARQAG